jgi:hypothetical protein
LISVQNSYSLYQREAEKDLPLGAANSSKKGNKQIFDILLYIILICTICIGIISCCIDNNLIFMPYASLGGLKARQGKRNMYKNFSILNDLIKKYNSSPHSIILAWMRYRYPNTILHITGEGFLLLGLTLSIFFQRISYNFACVVLYILCVGHRTIQTLKDVHNNVAKLELKLSKQDIDFITSVLNADKF